jgi:ATP-dependent RNA helicase DDX56/DBP9
VSLEDLEMIVVDEADLIMSYGYEEDLVFLKQHFPKIAQGFLMSATLNSEVEILRSTLLNSPVVIEVEEEEEEQEKLLDQFSVDCKEDDKFLLLYVMLKLNLVTGKTLIFVNDISRCFRVKLFLERFSIRSAVLNSELPVASRYHIVEEGEPPLFPSSLFPSSPPLLPSFPLPLFFQFSFSISEQGIHQLGYRNGRKKIPEEKDGDQKKENSGKAKAG